MLITKLICRENYESNRLRWIAADSLSKTTHAFTHRHVQVGLVPTIITI